jgi:hypothetical protein
MKADPTQPRFIVTERGATSASRPATAETIGSALETGAQLSSAILYSCRQRLRKGERDVTFQGEIRAATRGASRSGFDCGRLAGRQ